MKEFKIKLVNYFIVGFEGLIGKKIEVFSYNETHYTGILKKIFCDETNSKFISLEDETNPNLKEFSINIEELKDIFYITNDLNQLIGKNLKIISINNKNSIGEITKINNDFLYIQTASLLDKIPLNEINFFVNDIAK